MMRQSVKLCLQHWPNTTISNLHLFVLLISVIFRIMFLKALAIAALASVSIAHGNHGSHGDHDETPKHYPNWMTEHMAEEHNIDGWDIDSFFTLHDYDSDGYWGTQELLRTYGLMDPSNKHVTAHRKEEIVTELLKLLDTNGDGLVSRAEWSNFISHGSTLPDLHTGPGHHGDDEYEYETHHWNKYHDENTKLEDLTHPEDIEHFKHHEELEEQERQLEEMDKKSIVEKNIPSKFLRH